MVMRIWWWWLARRAARRAFCAWCSSRPADPDSGYCSPECVDEAAAWIAIH